MSAHICGPDHFIALATFAVGITGRGYPGSGRRRVDLDFLQHFGGVRAPEDTPAKVAETWANCLYRENIRSVLTRYPNDTFETAPGLLDKPKAIRIPPGAVSLPPITDPVAILKLCDGLAYQCCETDDWQTTPAHALLQAIQRAAVRDLPGYQDMEWTL